MFKKPEASSHVNITNIRGVTVVGNGNVVNTDFTELARALDELDHAIGSSAVLSDEQKLNAAGDLSTIRAQIAKKSPTLAVLATAWRSLEAVGTLTDVSDAYVKVRDFIGPIIGG